MLHRSGLLALGTLSLSLFVTSVSADDLKVGGTGAAAALMERMGEAFSSAHPNDKVEVVAGLGSSGGISALAAGVLQVAVSGRPLRDEERAKNLDSVPFLDTPFALVTSHPKPQVLSKSQVVAIHDGSLRQWSDGKEIKPILRPKSDAAAAFMAASFEGMPAAVDKLRQRPDVPVAATDQDNVEAAQKTANSFAGMTLVQFTTEGPRLRLITLDGVEPSVDAMQTGRYALKMRLHLATSTELSPVVRRFLQFLRSPEGVRIVSENGGVLVSTSTAAAQR